ncbi:MAG: hypothetical protein Q7S02_04795, partial [bacterium]|nr:hypothetical protein [bacterium]
MLELSSSLFLVIAIVVAVIVLAVIVLFVLRARARRGATLQRSFDMVVLQVLVPKESGGKEGEQQEGIQKIQEAIAKTEAFFTSIGGLRAQRGLKAWFSGRDDHFSFEVVAAGGQVKFFIAVPRAHQAYLEEQLHAQRSDASVEPAKDYNIFQPTGAIVGATLRFKRPGFFPIKSYKKLDSDPLDALTNAMSKVGEQEGA